jgi:hypothetical protein
MKKQNLHESRREAAELYWELLNAQPHMRRSMQNLHQYLRAYEKGQVNPLHPPTPPQPRDILPRK